MKLRWRIMIGVIAVASVGFGILSVMNRPISEEEAREKIQKHLDNLVEKHDDLSSILFTIHNDKRSHNLQFAVGTQNLSSDVPAETTSQYHSASVGKTMNATVFGMLVDEEKIHFDDKITNWLSEEVLEGLFVHEGEDYSHQVTIRHLLNHTSGIACFFEDPVLEGKMFMESVIENPDLLFTPEKLIAFTRHKQKPVGKPGDQFHYADTGYILLGLILEEIEGKTYAEILNERIFTPLSMNDSYLMFFQEEPANILGIYANGIDLSEKNALSLDWAGGGVVSTMDDLLTFTKALTSGRLVSDEVYAQMTNFSHKFDKGIYYGMGMMSFNFSELSFLLGSMSNVYGGMGVTGTYMFYDQENETYFVGNFGSADFTEKSIQELIRIRMIYDRIKLE